MSNDEVGYNIEVVEVIDNEDGSCRIVFDVDHAAIMKFAKIGLLKVLIDSAKLAEIEHGVDSDVGC